MWTAANPYAGIRRRHPSTPVRPADDGDRTPVPTAKSPPPGWRRWLIPAGLVLTGWLLLNSLSKPDNTLTYSTFYDKVGADQVESVVISSDGTITGRLKESAVPTDSDETADFRTEAP